jgi:hypothetical protein
MGQAHSSLDVLRESRVRGSPRGETDALSVLSLPLGLSCWTDSVDSIPVGVFVERVEFLDVSDVERGTNPTARLVV